MGFETLKGALEPQVGKQLLPEDLAFAEESLSDQDALDLVLADITYAESYFSQVAKASIDDAEKLYKGYVRQKKWGNGKLRSNLSMPLVMDAVEKLISKLHTTLWSGRSKPFNVLATGKTKPQAARAKADILAWAVRESGLEEQMRITLKSCLQFGYCLGEWGWEKVPVRKKEWSRSDTGQIQHKWVTKLVSRPYYRNLDLHRTFIDPKLNEQDPRKGGYIVKQVFLSANDLHNMRDDDTYKNIPTDDELRLILANREEPTTNSTFSGYATPQELQARRPDEQTSEDPLTKPLEYLEYWTDDRVIGVLQRKIPIRNDANEFGRKAQVGCAFIDVINSAHGFGVGRLLSGEQRFQTGAINNHMDILSLVLNPALQLVKGTGNFSQNVELSPGKVLNGGTGEFKAMSVSAPTAETMTAIQSSQDRAFKRVGANGGSNVMPQTLRTGAGVSSVMDEVTTRLQYFLNIFINLVFIPTLESMLEMCEQLSEEEINGILTEQQGKIYEGDLLEVYESTCRVEVIAGSKLTSRDAAAQLAPLIMQMLMAAPVQDSLASQGNKFNYAGFFEDVCDRLDWDIDQFIVPMDDKDQQRQDQQNGVAQKAQLALAVEQLRQQGTLNAIDRKGDVSLARDGFKAMLKGHHDADAAEAEQNQSGDVNGQ